MNNAYQSLVKATCLFLKQEGLIPKKGILPLPPKLQIPKPPIKPAPVPPPMPIPEPNPPPLPREEKNSLFEKIQKHLPHVRLVQTIPQIKQVAVVCSKQEDLPFLEKLSRAIERRFYPVSILTSPPEKPFVLIITQELIANLPKEKQIVLDSVENYENNTEQKKQLWNAICHHLSQKSS